MNWKLSKLLFEWLHEESDVGFIYETRSFFHDLTERDSKTKLFKHIFPWHPTFSLVLVLCEVLLGLTLVLVGTIQIVRDDILYTNQQTVNSQGCLSVKQGLEREYAMYLFNTSELWADTGIELSKGDKYRMSFSGAFHSSIGHLIAESENNNPKPSVIWTNCDTTSGQSDKKPYCVDPTNDIGVILYRVGPSLPLINADIQPTAWNRVDSNLTHKRSVLFEQKKYDRHNYVFKEDTSNIIRHSGTLQLAVNDVYFRDTHDLSRFANSTNERRFIESDSVISFFPSYLRPKVDSIKFCVDSILVRDTSLFIDNYTRMLYDDNLGQILLCLEIEHPIKNAWINPKAAFRDLEGKIRTYRYYCSPFWAFVRSLTSFTFWFLPQIIFIISFWFVVLFLVLYIPYWTGWWLAWPFRKLFKI